MATAKNNNILVVDDEPLNRLFLVDLLKMHNFAPSEAVNGQEAVALWQNNDYFAILMDIQMPVMNGIDATRTIRQQEEERGRPKTPIIAITAYCTKATEDDCRAAGTDAYLPKPLEISKLLEVIDQLQ